MDLPVNRLIAPDVKLIQKKTPQEIWMRKLGKSFFSFTDKYMWKNGFLYGIFPFFCYDNLTKEFPNHARWIVQVKSFQMSTKTCL